MMHRKDFLNREAALNKIRAEAASKDNQNRQQAILRPNLEKLRNVVMRQYTNNTLPIEPLVQSQGGRRSRRFPSLSTPKPFIEAEEINEPFVLSQGGLGDALLTIAASYRYLKCKILYGCNDSVKNVMELFFSAFKVRHTIMPTFHGNMRLFNWLASHPHCMSTCHIPPSMNYGDWGANKFKYEECIDLYLPVKQIFGTVSSNIPIITLAPGSINSGPDPQAHKQRSITKEEYQSLVNGYLDKYAVYVIGSEEQFSMYGLINHPNFHWMTFDTTINYLNQRTPQGIQQCFAIVNSSEMVVSVDTWLKTYSMLGQLPTTILQSKSGGKYINGPIDASDNIFLNPSLWNFSTIKVEDAIKNTNHIITQRGCEAIGRRLDVAKMQSEQHNVNLIANIANDSIVIFGYYVSIGDFLMMTPALKALKEQNPTCPIYLVIRKASATAIHDVFHNFPHIDGLVAIDVPFVKYNAIAQNYTAHKSINFNKAIQTSNTDHAAVSFAKLCGVNIKDTRPIVTLKSEDVNWADQYDIDDKCIVIHAGRTDWPGRNWIEERWTETCNLLKVKGWRVVRVGGGHEYPMSNADIDIVGKTSFSQTVSIINRCACVFGTDSSIMHISMALNKPTVGLFGCIDPKLRMATYPWFIGLHTNDLDCIFCWSAVRPPFPTPISCKRNKVYCMERISSEMAVDAIERAIIAHKNHHADQL